MLEVLIAFYIACQIFLLGLFTYFVFYKRELELTKDNLWMMATIFAFGPLGVMTFFGVVFYEKAQDFRRLSCTRAMTKWENKALEIVGEKSKWDWNINGKKSESRYNALRDTVECLTDKELELLVSVSKNTYELDKLLREAIMDEIVHRELMKL